MFLNTNTILIHGKQGWWKTMFATLLALDYEWRIFWNVWIKKGNNNITVPIESIDFLDNFSYSIKPGVVLFDEMGLNFNSKNFWSDKNKKLSNFFFLVRKYNLSSIFISQRFSSIPVDMRELADYIFEVSIIIRKWKHPVFRITRQTLTNEGFFEFEDEYIFDMISYLKRKNVSYDTLQSSIIV